MLGIALLNPAYVIFMISQSFRSGK